MKQEKQKIKFWQLKYDNVYFLNNINDNLQDKILEKFLDDGKKDDKNTVKVLLLTTELQEKEKI